MILEKNNKTKQNKTKTKPATTNTQTFINNNLINKTNQTNKQNKQANKTRRGHDSQKVQFTPLYSTLGNGVVAYWPGVGETWG